MQQYSRIKLCRNYNKLSCRHLGEFVWEIFRHELFTGRNVPGGYPRELSAMGARIPMREGVHVYESLVCV